MAAGRSGPRALRPDGAGAVSAQGSFASSPGVEQPGQFMVPVAMASDPQGRVHVSDSRLGTVQVFNPDGSIAAYSNLVEPRGIALTPAGLLLVSDDDGIEVIRPSDGAIQARWSSDGTRASSALAVSPNGDVYAVSNTDRVVYKFRSDGAPIGSLVGCDDGTRPGGQLGPTGVAAMSDGGVWVSDPDHRQIVRFGADDRVQRRCTPRRDTSPPTWRLSSAGERLLAISFGGSRAFVFGRPATLGGGRAALPQPSSDRCG